MKTYQYIFVCSAVLLSSLAPAQNLQSSHAPTKLAALVPAEKTGPPVARVNGVDIPRDQYEKELKQIFPYFSMHGGQVPDEYKENVRKKALDRLIGDELMFQEAKRRKLVIAPAEWTKRKEEIRKDFGGTPREFEAAMIRYFGSKQAFEAKLRHDMLLDKILNLEVKAKSGVTEVEVQKFYAQRKSQFMVPESISFQSLTAMFPANPTPADKAAARKRIEDLATKLEATKKDYEAFGLLAEKSSEDEYRVMMGFHKMAHKNSLDPAFSVLFTMKDGEVSKILESSGGYHILRLEKHQLQRQLPYTEVRKDLKASISKDKQQTTLLRFINSLRKTAKVEVL
jgi:parvulin-like peptidyl-prolyl isomerase